MLATIEDDAGKRKFGKEVGVVGTAGGVVAAPAPTPPLSLGGWLGVEVGQQEAVVAAAPHHQGALGAPPPHAAAAPMVALYQLQKPS